MNEFYQIIRFYGYSYKDMYVTYTKSEALFLAFKDSLGEEELYYSSFSEALQSDLNTAHKVYCITEGMNIGIPEDEGISLSEAAEYLEETPPEFPFVLLGTTTYVHI